MSQPDDAAVAALLLPSYVRTARNALTRALAAIESGRLDEPAISNLISAVTVANEIPTIVSRMSSDGENEENEE